MSEEAVLMTEGMDEEAPCRECGIREWLLDGLCPNCLEIARLQARVEELEGGLRPFADLWASDDPPVIRVRDLERAHALLTTTEEARGEPGA